MLAGHKIHHLKLKLVSFPRAIITFFSKKLYSESQKEQFFHLMQFSACLGNLELKRSLFHFCHFYFKSLCFRQKYFFT